MHHTYIITLTQIYYTLIQVYTLDLFLIMNVPSVLIQEMSYMYLDAIIMHQQHLSFIIDSISSVCILYVYIKMLQSKSNRSRGDSREQCKHYVARVSQKYSELRIQNKFRTSRLPAVLLLRASNNPQTCLVPLFH